MLLLVWWSPHCHQAARADMAGVATAGGSSQFQGFTGGTNACGRRGPEPLGRV